MPQRPLRRTLLTLQSQQCTVSNRFVLKDRVI